MSIMKSQIFALIASIVLTACNNSGTNIHNSTTTQISPLRYDFAEQGEHIVKSCKVIELSNDYLLSFIKKVLVLDNGNFIIMDKDNVYEFSAQGNAVRQYSRKGRGPAEYVVLTDIALDVQGQLLYILDGMNRVLRFSTQTGGFVDEITLKGSHKRVDGLAVAGDEIYIFAANSSFTKSIDSKECLFSFGIDGIMRGSYIACEDFTIPMAAFNMSHNGSYLVKPLCDNVIRRVGTDGITEAYQIDCNGKYAAPSAIYSNGILDIESYFAAATYKAAMHIQETDTQLAFILGGPNNEVFSVICDKNGRSGMRMQARDKITTPTAMVAADADSFYFVMDKYTDEGLDLQADPLMRYVVEQYGLLKEDDNPRLIGVEFKNI